MIKANSAPTAARKLVKRAPFTRRQIQQSSKAEEVGTPGATEARERITGQFAHDLRSVESTIAQTTSKAASFERCALLLKTRSTHPHGTDPLSFLSAAAVRFGADLPSLIECLDHGQKRATEAADRAQDRMDTAEPELRATASLMQLSAHLPSVKFDVKHPSVANIRRDYLAATQIAADQRKAKK